MNNNIKQLDKAIRTSWSRDTCHYKFLWDDKEIPPSAGHCRVVALLVQDFFGGDILYAHIRGNPKWDHYWNKLPNGKEVDLTKDQFPKTARFVKAKTITRKEALESKRTQKGYALLKGRVKKELVKKTIST